jgi:hypothetical protein
MSVSATNILGASPPWIPSSSAPAKYAALGRVRFLFVYGIPLFVASLLYTGYAVYIGNHALQIPLVYLRNDPSLYPHDPFAAALLSYATWFWPAVAWAARLVPLGWLLFSLFLCERALLLCAVGSLARIFSPRSELAVVAAMAIFASGIHPFVGGGVLVENYTEQTGFAIPFLLLGIAAFYRRRPIASAVWLAIGANMNILYGMYTLSYLGVVWLRDPEYRRTWRLWVLGAGAFLLLSSPIIVITALAVGHGATDNSLWYLAAEARHAHHLFPLRWGSHALAMQLALMILVLVLFTQRQRDLPRLSQHAWTWTMVAVAWLVYAFLAAYTFKVPALLVISAGRAIDLWLCFASVVLVSVIANATEGSIIEERLPWLCALAGSLLVWTSELSASIVGLGLVVLAWKPARRWVTNVSARGIAVALVGCLFLAGAVNSLRREPSNPMAASAFVRRPEAAMASIAEWARGNAPLDAVFLVDPTWGSFRALSRRPVFVTFQDGAAILWDRSFVEEWVRRLQAIGLNVEDGARITDERQINTWLTSAYERLTDADVRGLSEWASVRYWVVSRGRPSAFPVVYQGRSYNVLRVD